MTTTQIKIRKEPNPYNAKQRAAAVLSVWSQMRKPQAVCKQMSIRWNVLNQWQSKAMAALLKALEPSSSKIEEGPALSPRLEKLLARKAGQINKMEKLASRLEKIQQDKPVE